MQYIKRQNAKRLRLTVTRPGFAFSLLEKWDREMVRNILSRKCSMLTDDGEFNGALQTQLQDIDNQPPGKLKVKYYAPEATLPHNIRSRVFGKGLQSTPGWVRRLCSHKYYYDLDIVNCFPEILRQIKYRKEVDIDIPRLDRYIVEREAILAEDMQQIDGLTRKLAKEQYLKTMFGGGDLDYETPFLLAYKAEIEYIIEFLWRLPEYHNIRTYVESNRERTPNVRGSFLSNVITTEERKIIDVAMKRVAEADMGYQVDAYVFDGFMVQKKPGLNSFPPGQLLELSRAVQEETGYEITFVEKSLKPTLEDIERVRPAFNNMSSRSDWDAKKAFRELGKLSNYLNKTPKPENLKLFRQGVVPIMNEAFARLTGKFCHVAERTLGTRSRNDVTYQISKIEDSRKNHKSKTFLINDGEKFHTITPIDEWLGSDLALVYENICFNPRPYDMRGAASPFSINTFVGIAYPPRRKLTAAECRGLEQNQLKPFWDHVRNIWCKTNPILFNYVKHWVWSKVTRPQYRVECALILQSEQGAGKGIIVDKVAEVLGEQYLSKPSSLEQIVGSSFNKSFFENCLIMFLDEAFYAGSKATKNQVKTIITDPYVTVNEKYAPQYQVENFLSMILASNEDHVVNREVKARRYLNMSLSNALAGNHEDGSTNREYFNSISAVDPQLLSDYLHSIDVPCWSGRDIPTTLEGEEQAILSFNKLEEFIHAVMVDPTCIQECRIEYQKTAPLLRDEFSMPEGHDELEGVYLKSAIYAYFKSNFNRGYVTTQNQVTKKIRKYIPSTTEPSARPRIRGKQEYLIFFPTIQIAREEYKREKGLKHTVFH